MKKLLIIFMLLLPCCGSDEYKTYNLRPWDNGNVYYNFADEVSKENRDRIEYVFNEIENQTKCIYFLRSNNKNAVTISNILDGENQATKGCDNSSNTLKLLKTVSTRTIFHEVFHVLGMAHEHSRVDRDLYISVNYGNILDGYERFFDTCEHLYDIELFEYDYSSIMHYTKRALTRNGGDTIVFLDDNEWIYTENPTRLDWDKLISIYQPIPLLVTN